MESLIKKDRAFIAANKYIVKEINREGAGVLVSYDEEIEKSETKRLASIFSKNIWFDIEIPSREYLLNMELPLSEQSETVRSSLLSNEALSMLFYGEAQDMNRRTNLYCEDQPQEERLVIYKREMEEFYRRKRQILLDADSGLSIISLITNRTCTKDIEIASAFLNKYGVLGSLYKDDKGERVIIYDPHSNIELDKRHCERLEEALIAG